LRATRFAGAPATPGRFQQTFPPLLQLGAGRLGEAAAAGRAVAQAADLVQQVAGGGEGRQAPQQGDDRRQRRAPVAVQAQLGVVGAVAVSAGVAVVVGAEVAQGAVEAEDVVGRWPMKAASAWQCGQTVLEPT
jgi:hypothetical protein